jgi:hypothetical protein
MKSQKDPERKLHLVADEERPTTSQPPVDSLIADGVRNYQELQKEVDRALFARPQDVEKLSVLFPQLQFLRERLASYGVHV